MGINNLILTPEIIAALYPEALLIENGSDSGKKPVKSGKRDLKSDAVYPYLGKNLRSICFLVDHPDQEFIPESPFTFIRKILTACKCSMDDIAIINVAHQAVQLPVLKNQLRPEMIFLWGVTPTLIGIRQQPLPDLEISTVDHMIIVPVLNPERMNSESPEGIEMKQRFWTSLKKLFNL